MIEELDLWEVEFKEGNELKDHYLCAECGAPLLVAWGGYWGRSSYILRCGENIEHKGIVKPGKLSRDALPVYMRNNIERKEKKKLEDEYGEEVGTVVAKYQGITALTKSQAMEIIKSFWPDAPEAEVVKAALTCATYGLNPCMRQIYLIGYNNKTTGNTDWVQMLGIGATRLMASRRGPVGYKDGPRLMTENEQKDIRGSNDPKNYWAICVVEDRYHLTATGYGNYPMHDDSLKGRAKGNTEQNMAFIRAERNALEKKFPGDMPSNIEVIDDTYMGSPHTGEVIEGEAKVEKKKLTPKTKTEPIKGAKNEFMDACVKAGYDITSMPDMIEIGKWLVKHFSVNRFSDLTEEDQGRAIEMRLKTTKADDAVDDVKPSEELF